MLDMKRRFNIKSRNKTKENNEGIKEKQKLRKRISIKNISKKSITIKGIVLFCAFEMIFTTATFPFLLLHGPFETAKKTYVGAAMGSMTHQYLAKFFLSDEEIGEIIGDSEQVYTDATDVNAVTVNGIKDDTIELYEITDNPNFSGYYLIVKDPTRIKIGVTSKIGEEGETTTTIAENNNAIAAINGGAFIDSTTTKWTGTGGIPDGIIMSEGEVIFNNYGDTGKTDVFGITKNGVMIAGKYSYEELKELDVQEAVSYGPSLIINGNLQTISLDTGISPRTAIG